MRDKTRPWIGGPQCIGILPILHKSRKIKTPPKLRNSETPTQKLRNFNSETQKVRVSEFPRQSFRVSEAEFPSRTISGSFGVGAKSPKHYVFSGRTHFGSFRAGFSQTKSGNSETPPQKLRNTNSEIGFLSFRVGLSEFPSQTFRVSEVEGFPCCEGPCRFQHIGATQTMDL